MNRQVRTMRVFVDGSLERELYFIQEKDSVRVFGDGVMISGTYLIPYFRVRMIAEHRAMRKFGERGNKVRLEYSTYLR